MRELLEDVVARALRYLSDLEKRPVAPSPEAVEALAALAGPLPEHGVEPGEVLRTLDEIGGPATIASAGPRYFGFVTGGVLPAALAANWLAGVWDQNAFSEVSSPVGAVLDVVALGWVLEALGLPAGSGGGIVTGATMANFSGLLAARHRVLADAGWDVERQGMFGAPPVTVVVGDEAHASLMKALAMVGFGRDRVQRVATDDQGRMRPDALTDVARPAVICLQAGNVNTGAFDPAAELIPMAHDMGAWVHVDGAFGLWAAAAPTRAHLVAGYDRADSWAVDAHKWLNVPYDCGFVLVRDPTALERALSIRAAYLMEGIERDPFDTTPEASRRMRGADVWAALLFLGREGLADLVERNCAMAQRFASGLEKAGFDVLNDVVLNQVLVAFGGDEVTDRVIEAVQRGGELWAGATTWHGRRAMRISVSSWATTTADVDRSLEAIIAATAETQRT